VIFPNGVHRLPYGLKNGETKLIYPPVRRVKNHGFHAKAKNALAVSFSSHTEFPPHTSPLPRFGGRGEG
jgi:hypothetical protein